MSAPLTVVEGPFGKPDPKTIEYLESLLERARAGDVVDLAIAWGDRNDFMQNFYLGTPTRCLGLLDYLKFRITTELWQSVHKEVS